MEFIKEMLDDKQKAVNELSELVINTVHAKHLYRKGGWKLVDEKLGNKYMNPNFTMTQRTIQDKRNELNIGKGVRMCDVMFDLEKTVNEKLGVKAVKLVPSKNGNGYHGLKIFI